MLSIMQPLSLSLQHHQLLFLPFISLLYYSCPDNETEEYFPNSLVLPWTHEQLISRIRLQCFQFPGESCNYNCSKRKINFSFYQCLSANNAKTAYNSMTYVALGYVEDLGLLFVCLFSEALFVLRLKHFFNVLISICSLTTISYCLCSSC